MTKKTAALLLALVLVLSLLCTSALAAKPTAILTKMSKSSVSRGSSMVFTYRVNSGSYAMKSGSYRSRLASFIVYKKVTGTAVASFEKMFTGRKTLNVKWNVPRSIPKGKYYNLFGAFYKSGNSWYVSKALKKAFTVR